MDFARDALAFLFLHGDQFLHEFTPLLVQRVQLALGERTFAPLAANPAEDEKDGGGAKDTKEADLAHQVEGEEGFSFLDNVLTSFVDEHNHRQRDWQEPLHDKELPFDAFAETGVPAFG